MLSGLFEGAKRLEAQREADLKMVERVTFEVRDAAIEYWGGDGRLPKLEGAIVGRITFLSVLIDQLYAADTECLRAMHVAINRFDQACTGVKFQSISRVAEPARCTDVETTAYLLLHEALKHKRNLPTSAVGRCRKRLCSWAAERR